MEGKRHLLLPMLWKGRDIYFYQPTAYWTFSLYSQSTLMLMYSTFSDSFGLNGHLLPVFELIV